MTAQTLSDLLSQSFDLLLELAQQGIFGIFVDSDIILDVFGSVRILETGNSLIIVVGTWTDVGDHDSLGVTSEGVLQQSGEL